MCPIYFSIIRPFWYTAKYNSDENQIKAEIQGKNFNSDIDVLRKVLQFTDTVDDRCEYGKNLIKGLHRWLKYKGELEKSS